VRRDHKNDAVTQNSVYLNNNASVEAILYDLLSRSLALLRSEESERAREQVKRERDIMRAAEER